MSILKSELTVFFLICKLKVRKHCILKSIQIVHALYFEDLKRKAGLGLGTINQRNNMKSLKAVYANIFLYAFSVDIIHSVPYKSINY